VNSAAVFGRTSVGNIGIEEASRIVELDLLVPILLAQEFAARVTSEDEEKTEIRNLKSETISNIKLGKAQNEEAGPVGKIVNIVDVGGERPWKGYSVYCAAKAGLIAATKSLAKELAPGITVNAVAPGLVTWPEGMDEAGRKRQLGFIPAGRTARPEEIVAAVVFLLQNDYITGQVINVDGGRSA
jgi:NAD(P)-dependent dehydrogenase (short-subunit alcohol dehydrogenase family)